MEIVLFDLDHTIIDGDTDFLWGKFLVENNVVDKNYYESKNEYFFQEYQAGSLDPLEFARFSYKPLADNDYNRLLELREAFFTNKIRNIFNIIQTKVIHPFIYFIDFSRVKACYTINITCKSSVNKFWVTS